MAASMFFQLLYIHLFRPFLKYNQATSPLPAHVSPRKICTQAAAMISKLLRLYRRSHGLRQICNIAVYIAHSACTVHLLNLPEKNARRDIIHGVKHLEEIAEGWLCARRTLGILNVLSRKWRVDLPQEAAAVLARTEAKFGPYTISPKSSLSAPSGTKQTGSPQMTPTQSLQANVGAALRPPLASPTIGSPDVRTASISGTDVKPASPPIQALNDIQHCLSMITHQRPAPQQTVGTPLTDHRHSACSRDSPFERFGGNATDQLLRESSDWWLRDQSQLAVGFDNWNFSLVDGDLSAPPVDGDMSWLTDPAGVTSYAVDLGGNMMGGMGVAGPMAPYNEEEWYQ